MKNIMKQKKTTITASMVIAMLVVTAMVISKLMGLSFADNTFTVLNGKYIITSEKNMTAQYTGVSKNSVTSVNIPSTVEINGQMYKVTSIKANALKGNTKIKKLTIGSNVKTIGKKAFYGCKNLKTIAIKTSNLTSSSIKAGAFKGLNSKAVVTVPKEKLAAYKKILKVKGLTGKNQTIKGVKIETETKAEETKKEEEELDPNRVIPEPKVGCGIENHFDFDVTDAENCKQGEYVTGDTISITAGFQMDDTMYGEWTTRTAPGGFWIRCNACGKMFDNQEDFNIQSGFSIDGCTDGSFNFSSEYGQPFTAWHWVFDNRPCSATFHITLPEGLSYKDGTLKMYTMSHFLVDSSEYDVKVSGQDIVVTVDNIKKEAFRPCDVADEISVTLETVLNDNADNIGNISMAMTYNNGQDDKIVNVDDITIYNRGKGYDLYFYLKDESKNAISGAEFILYPRDPSDDVAAEGKVAVEGTSSIKTPGYYHVHGVPAGEYALVLVFPPAGYKKMPAIDFIITDDGKITSPSGEKLVSPGGSSWTKMLKQDGFQSTIILEKQ